MNVLPTDVAVLGAGTMGHALALVHALGGCRVRLYDNNPAQLEQAPELISAALTTLADAGEDFDSAAVLGRIATVAELPATVVDAELVVEAVVENREIKRRVFQAVDEVASEDAIIASNTSHLDVFPLIPERRQPQALIAHWYTPPYIIDLVDIAPGPQTRSEPVETLNTLYRGPGFGKRPVVFKQFIPGYIANRLQSALGLEVYHLLDEGLVSAADIDASVIHGLSLRMATLGFLKKADFTGLDMTQRAIANQTYTPPPVRDHSTTVDRLMAQGRSGVMAGGGFFDYGDRSAVELLRERDRQLLQLKATLKAINPTEDDE